MKKTMDLKKNKEFISLLGNITDKEVSEKYDVTISFVKKIRQERGIPAKRVHKFPEGIEKYAGKMTDKQAAEILKCDPSRVFLYRVEQNIKPCDKSWKLPEDKKNQIIKDYEELGTLQKVADKYGCTREWIRQMLKKSGYEKRYYNHNHPGA
ncbi:MAG: hypothetical protein MJZ37_00890 [Bacilli bacterium]|nr:hypothetical protein [Bacilli bacterium]